LKELLTSKKFIVTVSGIIVAIAARKGLNLDPELVGMVVALIVAYLIGQGASDFGKAAAQIKADAPISPEQINVQNVVQAAEDTVKPEKSQWREVSVKEKSK
jgi:hypothetical protein